MELSVEFVGLLETHAEISIRDHVARKRFRLDFVRLLETRETVWMPLTLEPAQRIVGCSGPSLTTPETGKAWLGIPGGRSLERFTVEFETLESLTPESGRFRVETFNAFQSQESARLVHRTVRVRIESTLRLDLRGEATRGRFRFFYSLGQPARFWEEDEQVEFDRSALESAAPAAAGGTGSVNLKREILEPRRFRPRRRGQLRR
jgi:hypothetical protein